MIVPTDEAAWLAGYQQMQQNSAAAYLDVALKSISENKIELTMPITDKVRQPMGLLHGGMSMMLAETAASMHASWGLDLSKQVPVGIEINGSHVRSASEGNVRAVGTVIRRTRSLIVHQVEIVHEETGKLLCTSRVTNYIKQVGKNGNE